VSGRYSREAIEARIGPELAAYCLKVAAEAPEPTPAQIDRIGRLFATAAERIEARQRAGEQGPALDQAA